MPLTVKVVLVGSHETYYLLKLEDEDFSRLFKVMADFESSMPRSRENVLSSPGSWPRSAARRATSPSTAAAWRG